MGFYIGKRKSSSLEYSTVFVPSRGMGGVLQNEQSYSCRTHYRVSGPSRGIGGLLQMSKQLQTIIEKFPAPREVWVVSYKVNN